jgi:hypothetical protein
MSFRDAVTRVSRSRPLALAAGLGAMVALFLAVWMLLAPHFEALGGVYRLAASRPPVVPEDPAVTAVVLGTGGAALLAGVLRERLRGRRTVR